MRRSPGRSIQELALSSSPVLVESEPGSEQDVVARAIHVGSSREERPFVRVTCAAFRGDALERELFGWRKGAFSGAFDDRAGRVELADGGTLYLDAPETPSRTLQARLIRLLDEGVAERVGSTDATRVDVRLVVALPYGIERAWRKDDVLPELASKLEVFPLRIPPLRDRKEDIGPLAEHFLKKYGRRNARAATSLSDAAKAALGAYDFPGNARELENVVERAAILARGDIIQPEHLAFSTRRREEPEARCQPARHARRAGTNGGQRAARSRIAPRRDRAPRAHRGARAPRWKQSRSRAFARHPTDDALLPFEAPRH